MTRSRGCSSSWGTSRRASTPGQTKQLASFARASRNCSTRQPPLGSMWRCAGLRQRCRSRCVLRVAPVLACIATRALSAGCHLDGRVAHQGHRAYCPASCPLHCEARYRAGGGVPVRSVRPCGRGAHGLPGAQIVCISQCVRHLSKPGALVARCRMRSRGLSEMPSLTLQVGCTVRPLARTWHTHARASAWRIDRAWRGGHSRP